MDTPPPWNDCHKEPTSTKVGSMSTLSPDKTGLKMEEQTPIHVSANK